MPADILDQITEESTKDDIGLIVDQVIADQQSSDDPPAEEISDSVKVASENETTEQNTGDEGEITSEAEETGDNSAAKEKAKADKADADWRDDAVSEAATYGIDKDELSEFSSREELDRALKLFDRQMDAERKRVTDGDPEKKDELNTREDDSVTPTDEQYKVQLDPEVYDEELVGEFEGFRNHYEGRIAALEQRLEEADSNAEETEFDRSVDDMGFAKLFGKTGQESKPEMERRNELLEHIRVERQVLANMGRPVGNSAALAERVARSLFPEDFDKRLIKNHTRKISGQSDKRQGDGGTRPTDPPETLKDEMRRIHSELDALSG